MFFLAAIVGCCAMHGVVQSPAGRPISNAAVAIHGRVDRKATSDAQGRFAVQVEPGAYEISARANGYATADVGPVEVDRDVDVRISLEPSDARVLRPIGEVTVDGFLAASKNTIPSVQIGRRKFEASGNDRIVDALPEIPSVTLPRPDGGAASAPAAVALRGPDPSETLVTLDGQILNDGNTGDLDLSRLPVSAFSGVNITEGLGPKDLEGSNTIGGGVNILSLSPTRDPHSAFSFSTGSFGRTEAWANATGSRGRLGYALALGNQNEQGYVGQDALLCADNPCSDLARTAPIHLGSTVESRSALANLTWNFSPNADVGLRVFSLGNVRDESGVLNAPDPGRVVPGAFVGPGSAVFAQNIRAYDLHGRAPLGSGSFSADFAVSDNNVDLSGSGSSPYDVSHQDKRTTGSLAWARTFERSEFSFGGYLRDESLAETSVDTQQSQHISSYFARGEVRASDRLRVSGAAYVSKYSSFGTSLDGRLGLSYDLDPLSTVRFSVGTGFRAPLLIERYVFAAGSPGLPPPNVDCVVTGQGNANEQPEHATEYELGYGKTLSGFSTVDVSLYRTNLRDPIEDFYPGPSCAPPGQPARSAYSYPINVGNVVYQGGALRFAQRFDKLTVTAQYGINIAYPYHFPATVSNPTSGAYLVDSRQFLGIPQQVGSLGFDYESQTWHYGLDAIFRGKNNELNQDPYTLINGGIGKRFGKADLTLAFANLGSDVSGKFTAIGGGVPYLGNATLGAPPAPIPTDRFFVEPRSVRLILTIRN
ncbi:MAG: TonB-dependent receptor [Candidatus Eremiobacteraeota bacterium]|nr:TonB-dependent receptor [Candidatus Eremiobacteraeota bacterium]